MFFSGTSYHFYHLSRVYGRRLQEALALQSQIGLLQAQRTSVRVESAQRTAKTQRTLMAALHPWHASRSFK